jgi:ArsR family transcriptional regulator
MKEREIAAQARLLGVLAHPTRLMILCELLKGVRCVNDITELLAVRQPNVSQHLMLLREHGLVGVHRDGTRRCYYLVRPTLVAGLVSLLASDHPATTPGREAAVRAAKRSRSSLKRRKRAARAAGPSGSVGPSVPKHG